jgi:hypothetical protein
MPPLCCQVAAIFIDAIASTPAFHKILLLILRHAATLSPARRYAFQMLLPHTSDYAFDTLPLRHTPFPTYADGDASHAAASFAFAELPLFSPGCGRRHDATLSPG